MLELTNEEYNLLEDSLRSHFATSKRGGNSSHYPHTKNCRPKENPFAGSCMNEALQASLMESSSIPLRSGQNAHEHGNLCTNSLDNFGCSKLSYRYHPLKTNINWLPLPYFGLEH